MDFYNSETGMPKQAAPTDDEVNSKCANIMNSFMQMAQENLTRQNMLINDLEALCEISGGRSDIEDAIEELKQKVVCNETKHWEIAEEWFKFFSGFTSGDDIVKEVAEENSDLNSDESIEDNVQL